MAATSRTMARLAKRVENVDTSIAELHKLVLALSKDVASLSEKLEALPENPAPAKSTKKK